MFKRSVYNPNGTPAIWRFDGGSGVTLENLTIRGTDPDHIYDETKAREHAIGVYGGKGFVATNVVATQVWGECLTGSFDVRQHPIQPPDNTTLENSTCDSGRQGVSVIAGTNFYIKHNTFLGSKLAEIDIEPPPDASINGVVVDGNSFYHPSWQRGPEFSVAGCYVSNVQVINNRDVESNTSSPVHARLTYPGCYENNFTVSGNYWLLNSYNGVRAPVDIVRWRYIYVQNNTFVANNPRGFGYIVKLVDSAHVWYSNNLITGPYKNIWQPLTADQYSYDIHVS